MPAGIPRVASQNPTYRQPASLDRTLSPNRLDGILAAGGRESAIRSQQGADPDLIQSDRSDQQPSKGAVHACSHELVLCFESTPTVVSHPTPDGMSNRFDVFGIGVSVMDFTMVVDALPEPEQVIRASDRISGLGGGVAVASATVAILGGRSAFADLLGTDVMSDLLIADLSRHGVDTSFVQRSAGQHASVASVLVTQSTGERTIVFSPGGDSAPPLTQSMTESIRLSTILHINGRHESTIGAAVDIARRAGTLVSYDGGAHRYRDAIVDLLRKTDILIVSEQFAQTHCDRTGHDVDQPAALAEKLMADFHPRIVGVTCGESGSWFLTTDDAWHQPAETVEQIVDTTGCGDTFHGAFLLAHARGKTPRQCARFASVVATENAKQLGALSFDPTSIEMP